MNLETFFFDRRDGWSLAPLPQLDSERTLVLVFGASGFVDDPAPLHELRRAYPKACWAGCSTSGEIHGTVLMDDSLSVAVARFDGSTLRSSSVAIESTDASFAAGTALANELAGPGLRAVFLLSDGLHVNGSELVRGVASAVPSRVVITGGLAGDGDRFQRTWVLDREGPCSRRVTAVGLYGDRLRIGHGSKGGWDQFGPARRVTRSQGNVLQELDGRPALRLYKEYLGERARGLPASALLFPLALASGEDEETALVRTVLSVSEEDQSMTFAGDVPEGAMVQLMRANFERLIDGAGNAARGTRLVAGELGPGTDVLSVAISCVGRRLILGERTEEEIEAALAELPPQTRQVGFYSYGEISPLASGTCSLHNQTMTLTTIAEI